MIKYFRSLLIKKISLIDVTDGHAAMEFSHIERHPINSISGIPDLGSENLSNK